MLTENEINRIDNTPVNSISLARDINSLIKMIRHLQKENQELMNKNNIEQKYQYQLYGE